MCLLGVSCSFSIDTHIIILGGADDIELWEEYVVMNVCLLCVFFKMVLLHCNNYGSTIIYN
jgi:hypothetical protein